MFMLACLSHVYLFVAALVLCSMFIILNVYAHVAAVMHAHVYVIFCMPQCLSHRFVTPHVAQCLCSCYALDVYL
jgi:hypothetical protein